MKKEEVQEKIEDQICTCSKVVCICLLKAKLFSHKQELNHVYIRPCSGIIDIGDFDRQEGGRMVKDEKSSNR